MRHFYKKCKYQIFSRNLSFNWSFAGHCGRST